MFRDVHELVADSTTNEYLSFTGGKGGTRGTCKCSSLYHQLRKCQSVNKTTRVETYVESQHISKQWRPFCNIQSMQLNRPLLNHGNFDFPLAYVLSLGSTLFKREWVTQQTPPIWWLSFNDWRCMNTVRDHEVQQWHELKHRSSKK